MGYSIQHLRIDKKHILTLIDEQTTLPSLFVAIYSIRKLSLLRFRTQEKELFTLKYFFEFWENKFSKTFDFSFRESNYDIANCISELDGFYHHLSNKKHLRSTIGGCTYDNALCPFSQVRACYGCLYFKPFIDGEHQKVFDSINEELIQLIKQADSSHIESHPLIAEITRRKQHVMMVMTRIQLYSLRNDF